MSLGYFGFNLLFGVVDVVAASVLPYLSIPDFAGLIVRIFTSYFIPLLITIRVWYVSVAPPGSYLPLPPPLRLWLPSVWYLMIPPIAAFTAAMVVYAPQATFTEVTTAAAAAAAPVATAVDRVLAPLGAASNAALALIAACRAQRALKYTQEIREQQQRR